MTTKNLVTSKNLEKTIKPYEIVVISGKGGTGKTSLTAALAQCMPQKVLVDCDVDAADLHLLLKIDSTQSTPFHSGYIAEIDQEKCENCGLCASHCRFDAIKTMEILGKSFHSIKQLNCEGCKVCVNICPHDAILWKESVNGNWMESRSSQGFLYHARLNPGAENSGKLVAKVRQQAQLRAVAEQIPLILVDGPPGVGCPVIASVTGADSVLIITEPTPSGLHDMQRVLQLAQHFRIPAFVIINKADLSFDYCKQIEQSAKGVGAKVIAQLMYSPLFTEAQMKGQSIMEAFPESDESNIIRHIALTLLEHSSEQRS